MNMSAVNLRVVCYRPPRRSRTLEVFLKRPTFDSKAQVVAQEILSDIAHRGLPAVLAAVSRIDKVSLRATELRISEREFEAADSALDEEVKARIREAHDRVAEFARKSMRPNWSMKTPNGGVLGELFRPLERVGVYVPGGTAPLASTVIMTATLAQVAGVPEIVACTPCAKDKTVRPEILYAMKLCGIREAYRIGGIQAIGLMAYGIRHTEPVQKIVGPGNAYVTAAKQLVYGTVALDLVAGPSEIAILADDSMNPDWIAADLLSQAEHGSGFERSLFITDSEPFAQKVSDAIAKRIPKMSRKDKVMKVIENFGILLLAVPSIEVGLSVINRFAPEHFELMVKDPERYLPHVKSSGAVFVGPWTPESAGDFAAGPSHVLPTGGAGHMFNGLTVEDFRHRTSMVQYTEKDLSDALPIIRTFSDIEGLDGHRWAGDVRFNQGTESAIGEDGADAGRDSDAQPERN